MASREQFFMPRPRKHAKDAKRESPVQFRLESDLGRLVRGFAERHKLGMNEAAKALIALSVVALDCRYYGLLRQMADSIGGSNPFVSACLRVNASLEGAAMVMQQSCVPEAERPGYILRVADAVLAGQGKRVDTSELGFMTGNRIHTETALVEEAVPVVKLASTPKRRRKIRKIDTEE